LNSFNEFKFVFRESFASVTSNNAQKGRSGERRRNTGEAEQDRQVEILNSRRSL